MILYFPDTNFFFEFRKASDLPWHELEGLSADAATEVRLIVPSSVVTEIERHKQKGNSRTAKRARDASTLLRQALQSPDHSVEIRASKPRVVLVLPPVVKTNPVDFPNLDPARSDHRIVMECAELLKTEAALRILTDDTLLVLAARSVGLAPILLPESWKLPPEKDERDDEIERLREEVRSLKQTTAEIAFSVQDVDGNEIKVFDARLARFEIADLDVSVAAVEAAVPMETDFRLKPTATSSLVGALGDPTKYWRAPRQEDIERYKAEAYPSWLEKVRRALPGLAIRLTTAGSEVPFSVSISNSGFVNALNVRLTIDAFDGVLLQNSLDSDDREEREKALALPPPPEPPRGHYVSIAKAIGSISHEIPRFIPGLLRSKERDPTGFYYIDYPRVPTSKLELTCEALPHQTSPYDLGFRLLLQHDELGKQPRVRVRLEASNLRKPVERFLAVKAAVEPADFNERLEELIMALKRRR